MVKRSFDEPADKASERLRQMEEARKPMPDENVFKTNPDASRKAGKASEVKPKKSKKSKQKSTKKNK